MRTYLESVEDRMATLEHDPDGGSLYLAVRALGAMETALREMVRENDALVSRVASLESELVAFGHAVSCAGGGIRAAGFRLKANAKLGQEGAQ